MIYTGIILGGPNTGEIIENEGRVLVVHHQLKPVKFPKKGEFVPPGDLPSEDVYYDYIEEHGQGFWKRRQ
jgi:hypothetical protein